MIALRLSVNVFVKARDFWAAWRTSWVTFSEAAMALRIWGATKQHMRCGPAIWNGMDGLHDKRLVAEMKVKVIQKA